MWLRLEFLTLDQQATQDALGLLAKADQFRRDGKPQQWAVNIERKALRKLAHSYELRHMFDIHRPPRPSSLPPSSYERDNRPIAYQRQNT